MTTRENIYAAQMLEEEARELEAQAVELRQRAKLIRVAVRQEKMRQYGDPEPASMDDWDGLKLHIRHNPDPGYKDSSFILPGYGQVLHQLGNADEGIVTWDGRVVFRMIGCAEVRTTYAHGRRELREHLDTIKPIYGRKDGRAVPSAQITQEIRQGDAP